MQEVYVWSRKIHRLTLFFVVILGFIQMLTGIMMKFGWGDIENARIIHNAMSLYFVIALAAQMVTGVYMYIHPWIVRWNNSRSG